MQTPDLKATRAKIVEQLGQARQMVKALEQAKAALDAALSGPPPKTQPKPQSAPKGRKRVFPRAPNGMLRETVLSIVKENPGSVVSEVIKVARGKGYAYKLDPLEVSRALRALMEEKVFSRVKNGQRWEYSYVENT